MYLFLLEIPNNLPSTTLLVKYEVYRRGENPPIREYFRKPRCNLAGKCLMKKYSQYFTVKKRQKIYICD